MNQEFWLWTGFNVFVVLMLILDIGVFNKKSHEISIKEALLWSVLWIGLALLFNIGIWVYSTPQLAFEFATGYVIEKSLSVDNLFVFLALFNYFKVPAKYQHKVLFWGIVGALLLRAIFIIGGVALITTFHYIIYVFGAFLVYTGIKLFFNKDEQIEPEKNPLLKFIRRYMPVTKQYYNDKFFIKRLGHTIATPLFVVLILIESTDVIFAVDSIPAVLAISKDPFIIYTSNIFAILGLRTLYFALAGIVHIFHYLNAGMAIILMFIGAKMLVSDIYKLPIEVALGIVIAILIGSVVLSLLNPRAQQSIVSKE